jgi:hypothetical protein
MYQPISGAANARRASSWDPAVLDSLADINERVIEVLASQAGSLRPYASPLSAQLADEWRGLDALGRSQLAASPYLLLDCQFSSEELWSGSAYGGVRDAGVAASGFTDALGAKTLRHAMLLAWHWSRANPITAQIALGLSESCVCLIAGSRLRDLEALAEQGPAWIRPRWEERPDVWRQLLTAAAPLRPALLRKIHLRGLQLLAASARCD